MSRLRFKNLSKGDLLFWSAPPPEREENGDGISTRPFDEAVSAAGGNETAPFHVSIVADTGVTIVDIEHSYPTMISMVHAIEKGVVLECAEEYCRRLLENDYAKLKVSRCSVEAAAAVGGSLKAETMREHAVRFALAKTGCAYNDIFSEDCRNSSGVEAYYCCQLIRKSYENALGRSLFPLQPLNFRNAADGQLIQYWVEYFEKKGRPVPEDGFGSNPMSLMKSDCIRVLEQVIVEQK